MINYLNTFKYFSQKNSIKAPMGKVKITLISILLGLFFGSMIVAFMGINPIVFIKQLFSDSFSDKSKINILLIWISVLMISGLANAFAFRTGLFNIGVSGQMLAGGGVAMVLSLTIFDNLSKIIAIPILLVVAILVSGIVGAFAAILKTKFNVHEVVSTILLNWIIFYLIKYIFLPGRSYMNTSGSASLTSHHHFHSFLSLDDGWYLAIMISFATLIGIYLLLKFTVFGKSLKMTGINAEAARYSGINTNRNIIYSLTISSALSGVLAILFYFGTKGGVMPAFGSDVLPMIGFDGIALALLAFNAPLGMIPIAMLYAIFKTSAPGLAVFGNTPYKNQLVSLVFSVIIYFAAISSVFLRFKPVSFINQINNSRKNSKLLKNKYKINKIKLAIKNETSKEKIQKYKSEIIVIKKMNNEINNKLVKDSIDREFKVSKNYVKIKMFNRRHNKISFQKMALSTKMANINKNIYLLKEYKNELKDLKKDKKNITSISEIKEKIKNIKEVIKRNKIIRKEKINVLLKEHKENVKKIKFASKNEITNVIKKYEITSEKGKYAKNIYDGKKEITRYIKMQKNIDDFGKYIVELEKKEKVLAEIFNKNIREICNILPLSGGEKCK